MGTQQGDLPTVTAAFRAGDAQALAEVYGRWSPLVYSIALHVLGDVTDAEDVTQQVFTGAWTSRQTFDPARGRLSAWLVQLTLDRVADARVARGSQTPATAVSTTALEDTARAADLAERLLLADTVAHLDAEPQQVLRMALHDDLTHVQIAERTGLPATTVAGHLRRGLVKLRQRLEVQPSAH